MILYFVVHKLCQSTVMDRRYDFVLLLTGIASLLYSHNAGASVVSTAPTVQGWKGEDIRLRCDILEKPFVVIWVKESISYPGLRTTKADFFDGNVESREERFDMDKNFSLVISDLEVADEGRYVCQAVLKNYESYYNSTIMTINSMASRHTIEECDDKSQSRQSRCTYQSPSNTSSFTLTCVVSGFKPNISMLWTEESGKRLNSVVSQQNTLSDDTYERFETITVSAKHRTEQTFMCMATGDSLNGTSRVEITVLPVSGKRGNSGHIIALAIAVPVALAILFLLVGKYLQNKHPDYLPRQGCGWNPCWRRPNIPERFHEEEELMPKQVQQCKEELKAYYRTSRRKVTVDPLNIVKRVELDEIYTNLSIIYHSRKHKTPITYDDLLTNYEHGNLSKRFLIQGEGGVGKTMLCAKIAWDWCQGRILQDLDMVLLIPLHDVTNKKSIGGIVKKYLSDSNTAETKQINGYILANQNRVLIIFDGFDEFNGKLSEKGSSEVIRILKMQQYESCKVIVTTRPWRTDEFMMDKSLADAYTVLNVEGFSEENVSTYITRYFRITENDNLAENLISFMEENDVIQSNMAPYPLYCALLCLMWNEFRKEKRQEMQILQTFSKLFEEMITFLKDHYASKVCENLHDQNVVAHLKKAARAIQEIGEIALNGLLDRKLSFPEEHFRKCHDAMETCRRVGVLTIERDVITRDRRRDVNIPSLVVSTISFPHKLFQEYIAGVYIEYLFVNDSVKYEKVKNKLLSRHEEFRYLLYFTSALGNEVGLDIIHGLMNLTGIRRDYCVDVAFECHTEEAARAVGERWEQYEFSRRTSGHTNSGVVFMVRRNQVRTLVINEGKCGRTLSRDLAEGMFSSYVLHKVEIRDPKFHTDFYKILCREASNCQIQDLELRLYRPGDDPLYQSWVGGDLAQWVFAMPHLSKFKLDCPYLTDSVLSTAAASASSCQIRDLELCLYGSGDDPLYQSSVGGDLAQWVFTMPGLSKFSLGCLYLTDSFLSTAAASASSCQIKDLDLNFYDPGDDPLHQSSVGGDLAQWVSTMPGLSKFSLVCPYLADSFLSTAFASASSCQIQDLELHLCGSGDDPLYQSSVGGDLAKWVFAIPRLSKFSLVCPYLTDSFLSTAASSASSCQIQDLKLRLYGSGDDPLYQSSMGGDLAQWVSTMPRLSKFQLECPFLTDSFLLTAAASALSCQIQDLKLRLYCSGDDPLYQSSVGGDLAQWVFTMPRLSKFQLECPYLPDSFLSTAFASASSCQIEDLKLRLYGSGDDPLYQSSVGGDLAQWVSTMPRLSKFSLRSPYLTDSFLSTAFSSASSCQIQDLELRLYGSSEIPLYQTSVGGDLAKWVFTMPHLSKFSLVCSCLQDSFLSTAAASASSCQIRELALESFVLSSFLSESAGPNLAEFLCRLPHLERADLVCDNLPRTFFTAIASQAPRCKMESITINNYPLSDLLSYYQNDTLF